MIESQGQAPTVLDQTVYVNRPTTQLPIHWLDSRTLLFQSEDSAWRMDMETGRLQRVFEAGQDERLVTFQYDPSSERIYWLAEALREENGDQYWVGNLHIYNKDMELLERVEGISDLWPADHNTLLPLDLSIQESSLYITTFKDGKVVTYYELLDGNDDGSMDAIQLGRLIGTAEDGAFLAVNEDGDELLTWWMKDGETKPISSLGATNYMMFGGDVFALKEGRTNTYFIYSRSQDEWLEWSPNDGRDSWIPNQETAYYRITN